MTNCRSLPTKTHGWKRSNILCLKNFPVSKPSRNSKLPNRTSHRDIELDAVLKIIELRHQFAERLKQESRRIANFDETQNKIRVDHVEQALAIVAANMIDESAKPVINLANQNAERKAT